MKVCFFSPTAYAYFNPDSSTWAGGAEVQQVLLARKMAGNGLDVSFIVGDYGQPDSEIVDGITIIKSFEPFKGNRKLRFVPDMLKIYGAMKVADADIYNQRSTSFFTGQLACFASRLGKAFTFSIGIDYNCYPDGNGLLPLPVSLLYRYGIRKADAVIAQTEEQRRLFTRNFGKEPVLIRNGIEIPHRGQEAPGEAGTGPHASGGGTPDRGSADFLWVGSFRRRKRPELYIELARRVPEARFNIIGGVGDDRAFYEEMRESIEHVPNVNYLGFVPPEEIEAHYRSAYALINTSNLEGFPNTYLHSWVHGVPTLTIEIDPDGIIESYRIGEATGTFEGLVSAVRRIFTDPSLRTGMSERARRYVEEHHDIRDRADDHIRLFDRILKRSSGKGRGRSG